MRRATATFGRVVAAIALATSSLFASVAPALAQTTFVTVEGDLPAGWSVEYESHRLDYENGATIQRIAATDDLSDPVAEATIYAERSMSPNGPTTYEEFLDGYDPRRVYGSGDDGAPVDSSSMAIPNVDPTYSDVEAGTTEIAGIPFWYVKNRSITWFGEPGTPQEDWSKVDESWQEVYYGLLSDGSSVTIIVSARSKAGSEQYLSELESQAKQVFSQLLFDFGDGGGASGSASTGGTTGTAPWRTVAGGMAAVLAAAAALVSAAAMQASRKNKVDPEATAGYVLQLSTTRLQIASQTSATLSAQVWRVTMGGRTERAAGAQISLETPADVEASPATGGGGTIQASVWQTGELRGETALVVAASAPGGSTRSAVTIIGETQSQLLLSTLPKGKTSLRPNGEDSITVVATLELGPTAAADPNVSLTDAQRAIAFDVGGAGPWLDSGTPRDVEDGRAIDIAASSPDPDSTTQPPETITIAASVKIGAEQLHESITIALERPPRLDARPDTVEFAAKSGTQAEVIVWIESPGDHEWEFTHEWAQGTEPPALIDIQRESRSSAVLTLTEDAADLPLDARSLLDAKLIVFADTPAWDRLERHITVIVRQEGLFLVQTGRDVRGTYRIAADGTSKATEIDIAVYVRTEAGEIVLDSGLAQQVTFEPAGEKSAGKAAWEYGPARHEPAGMRTTKPPSAIHRFTYPRVLPTEGEPMPLQLRATVPGREEEEFTRLVPVELTGVDMSPYSSAWNTELERCRYVIDEYVPPKYQPELLELLNHRAKTFGAEGLYEMRKQLWSFAYTQTMREYHDAMDEAWWYEQIEDVLDWVSWCGDIALAVASGRLVGTAAAVGVGMLKPVLVSAIDAWVNGRSIEEWAWGQVSIFAWALEGAATDVDLLIIISKKMGAKGVAMAWAAFISYTFVKELVRDPNLSVYNAMINTCRLMRDQALISFLRKMTGTSAVPRTDAEGTATKPDAPTRPIPVDSPAAKKIIARTKHRNGKPYADPVDVLEIMRDPTATRSLKHPDTDPAVRQAFENTRQEIYGVHDSQLQSWVENNVASVKGKKVRVAEVRTPGKEATFNTDRDFRVLTESTDPKTGETVWVEVPRKNWERASNRIFAENTGGPAGDPAAARQWADDHQQVGTDAYHAEAPPDMSDQVWTQDNDGRMVRTQKSESQLARVKRGEGTLLDPETLGRAYENKIIKEINSGKDGEAFVQAKKASQDLRDIRNGYEAQGKPLDPLDPQMQSGMDIVERIGTEGFDDPQRVAQADAELKNAGFPGGLRQFANRLGGKVGGLRWVK